MLALYPLPWFAPRLSKPMATVMNGLGHRVFFNRGQVVYESKDLFNKLIFLKVGLVSQQLLEPICQTPLTATVAGVGALSGGFSRLYVVDRMPRRHIALTRVEALIVNTELLLNIADQNQEWQHELSSYAASVAISDQLSLYVNRTFQLEERLIFFIFILMLHQKENFISNFFNLKKTEWISLPAVPSTIYIAQFLGTNHKELLFSLKKLIKNDDFKLNKQTLYVKKQLLMNYWETLESILTKLTQIETDQKTNKEVLWDQFY